MTEHTPGPWGVKARYKSRVVESQAGEAVAGVYMPSGDNVLVQQANGRLIAAAPDLLDALEVTVKRFMDEGYDSTNFEEAIDAIAKARGECT